MDFRIFTEPQQGATYSDLLAVARRAEETGYSAFFRSDHFLAMGSSDGMPGPTDAWLTLAALARETTTIRLGTLVTSATFRLPAMLAIAVAQVDEMSGGRVELGLGTGWYEAEHTAYGIPFPPLAERFAKLEEQLTIIRGLWTAPGPYSFAGSYYTLTDSPALPKPVQSPHPPIIIGGAGQKKTPRLAAEFADEYNIPFAPVEFVRTQFDLVRSACEPSGKELTYSSAQIVCVGKDDAEVRRRAAAIGRDVDELRTNGLAGTIDEVTEKVAAFVDAGATRLYLQVMDLSDLDHLDLFAEHVAPHFTTQQ